MTNSALAERLNEIQTLTYEIKTDIKNLNLGLADQKAEEIAFAIRELRYSLGD